MLSPCFTCSNETATVPGTIRAEDDEELAWALVGSTELPAARSLEPRRTSVRHGRAPAALIKTFITWLAGIEFVNAMITSHLLRLVVRLASKYR